MRLAGRIQRIERRRALSGTCPHLPPIIERRGPDGELLPDPEESCTSEFARQQYLRRLAEKVSDDAVCGCGRERLKIVMQYVETPPTAGGGLRPGG